MVTSGLLSPISQLFPSRRVRKLEGCEHEMHTACFQNWVNKELATNTDHQGPVSCPICRRNIPDQKHSMVELFDVVPSPRTIHSAAFLAEMFLNGVGVVLLVSSSKASSVYKKVALGAAGAAVIFGRIVGSTYYVTRYSKNQVNMLLLLLKYYNFRRGTDVQRKDLNFGLTHDLSRKEWLKEYYSFLGSGIIILYDQKEGEPPAQFIIGERENFIQKMEDALDEYSVEVPETIQNAGKHFWQYAIDPEKQKELFGFLTERAFEKKLIQFDKKILGYDYSNISYTNFCFVDGVQG